MQKPRGTALLRKRRDRRRAREPAVGYELSTSDEENWIRYHPETGELDLVAWRDSLEGHADWDVWHDRKVANDEELERRLLVLKAALRADQGR